MDYKDFIQLQNQQELHFWYKARKKLILNLLNFKFKNYKQNRLILNIGCGTGTEMEIIKKFGQVMALDNNQNAINIVKQQGYKTILADVEKYNLKNNYYDAVCCFDVLEHLYGSSPKCVGELIYKIRD
ncbi:MAG: class I SAM-dependent methyltransferase [bacterium]